jgi:hypothetical protein
MLLGEPERFRGSARAWSRMATQILEKYEIQFIWVVLDARQRFVDARIGSVVCAPMKKIDYSY